MAAALLDAEIMWRIGRMPLPEERSNLDRAVFKEALRRGLLVETGDPA